MSIRDDLRYSLEAHGESEADIVALLCQPNEGNYELSDKERKMQVRIKHIDDLPTEADYGEDTRILAFTKNFVYINAHYDGTTWVTGIPRSPSAARAQDWFPNPGGG